MGSKGICILVVNDDLTCNSIVAEMLQHTTYEVLHIGGALDVLNSLWETKDMLELVLTNAHRLGPNGIEIVQHIKKKLNLPVLLMSPDKMKIASAGIQPSRFSAYILSNLSTDDANSLWQFALDKERAKNLTTKQERNAHKASSISHNTNSNISPSISEDRRDDPSMEKKPRVVWTKEMHQKFLEALKILGYDRAVPKKIVEVMSIPGLSRENVASHLQKYRKGLKRTHEVGFTSISGMNSTLNEFNGSNMPIGQESNSRFIPQSLNNDQTSFGISRFCHQLPQNVPTLHLNPNFRIYCNQTKNMLLNVSKSCSSPDANLPTSSDSGFKFVGYRLTSDEKSIVLCNEESVSLRFSRETLGFVSGSSENQCALLNSVQVQNPSMSISQQPYNLPRNFVSGSSGNQGVLLNSVQDQNPSMSISQQPHNLQRNSVSGSSGNQFVLLNSVQDQNPSMSISQQPYNLLGTCQCPLILESPMNESSEQCMFFRDQEITFPTMETIKYENLVQDSCQPLPQMMDDVNDFDEQEQQQEGIDDVLIDVSGSGGMFPQIEWQEFEDTLVRQDD